MRRSRTNRLRLWRRANPAHVAAAVCALCFGRCLRKHYENALRVDPVIFTHQNASVYKLRRHSDSGGAFFFGTLLVQRKLPNPLPCYCYGHKSHMCCLHVALAQNRTTDMFPPSTTSRAPGNFPPPNAMRSLAEPLKRRVTIEESWSRTTTTTHIHTCLRAIIIAHQSARGTLLVRCCLLHNTTMAILMRPLCLLEL